MQFILDRKKMSFEYIPNQYKNAILDRKNSIFIMYIFLEFKKTYFICNIPNEIFKLIIEYYYDCCISESLCKKIKCIKRFKKNFNPYDCELTGDIYCHCLNCHRYNSSYECNPCFNCQKLCCGFCSIEFQHLTYRCFLCDSIFNSF